jgi:hypothetical protein
MLVLYHTITSIRNSAMDSEPVIATSSSDDDDDVTEGVETDTNSSEGAKQKLEPSAWTSNAHATAHNRVSDTLAAHSLEQVHDYIAQSMTTTHTMLTYAVLMWNCSKQYTAHTSA